MQVHGVMGWSKVSGVRRHDSKTIDVKCIPIFSILSAMEVKVVDYFSLDIEGNELQVLKTIPFESILIKVKTYYYRFLLYA